MATIDKGILTIDTDYDNGNRKRMIFNSVDGTVWLIFYATQSSLAAIDKNFFINFKHSDN